MPRPLLAGERADGRTDGRLGGCAYVMRRRPMGARGEIFAPNNPLICSGLLTGEGRGHARGRRGGCPWLRSLFILFLEEDVGSLKFKPQGRVVFWKFGTWFMNQFCFTYGNGCPVLSIPSP